MATLLTKAATVKVLKKNHLLHQHRTVKGQRPVTKVDQSNVIVQSLRIPILVSDEDAGGDPLLLSDFFIQLFCLNMGTTSTYLLRFIVVDVVSTSHHFHRVGTICAMSSCQDPLWS